MLDGIPLIDAHVHAARLPTLKQSWREWAAHYGSPSLLELYDEEGTLLPERFDHYMATEGVDIAILLCEYSPKSTGIQPIEDLLPLLSREPRHDLNLTDRTVTVLERKQRSEEG